MASSYSPWWRRFLQRQVKWLFSICPGGNYHWFWSKECHCCVGQNSQGIYYRQWVPDWRNLTQAERELQKIFYPAPSSAEEE